MSRSLPIGGKGALIAGSLGVLGLAASVIAQWEGRRTAPYRDIVGIWTVCDGQTQVAMRRYSHAECDAMLTQSIAVDYAPAVYRCVPGLRRRMHEAAAAISLAYNIGTSAFCRSSVARKFNAGDWRGGCKAFALWVNAGGRPVRGLVNRRNAEIALCLKGHGQ